MQYAVYLLEDGIKRSEKNGQSDQVCIIYDRSGFNYKNFDYQLFSTSKNLVTMLQDNYAERLGALYVLGVGWFYWMIFNIIKVFLTERSKYILLFPSTTSSMVHLTLFFIIPIQFRYHSKK